MDKPLVPAIDAAGQLRELAFAMLVREQRPLGLDDLTRSTGLGPGVVRDLTATLAGAGWLDLDEAGRIAGAAGLSLVETACGQCGEPIRIQFDGGVPERAGPERIWLADGGEDLRGSFCTPTVPLCGEAHGAAWAEAQTGRGRLLDLAEGARLGSSDWAGCAEATRRLA